MHCSSGQEERETRGRGPEVMRFMNTRDTTHDMVMMAHVVSGL